MSLVSVSLFPFIVISSFTILYPQIDETLHFHTCFGNEPRGKANCRNICRYAWPSTFLWKNTESRGHRCRRPHPTQLTSRENRFCWSGILAFFLFAHNKCRTLRMSTYSPKHWFIWNVASSLVTKFSKKMRLFTAIDDWHLLSLECQNDSQITFRKTITKT